MLKILENKFIKVLQKNNTQNHLFSNNQYTIKSKFDQCEKEDNKKYEYQNNNYNWSSMIQDFQLTNENEQEQNNWSKLHNNDDSNINFDKTLSMEDFNFNFK